MFTQFRPEYGELRRPTSYAKDLDVTNFDTYPTHVDFKMTEEEVEQARINQFSDISSTVCGATVKVEKVVS